MTLILTLLLVTQVTAEWVEISQQHYRKPIRAHSPFAAPDKVIDIEDTTKPWSYNNRSVMEYNWNKNPARPPNIGNTKRVQHIIGSNEKTTERLKQEDDDDLDLHVDFRDYEVRPNYAPTRPTIELHEHDKQTGTIERVPNVGNIKRVQLNNSPVKSPTLNYKGNRQKYTNNRSDNRPHNDDNEGANVFEHKKNTESFNRRIYVNKVKNPHSTERTATFPPDDDEEQVTTYNTEPSKQRVSNFYTTKPTFVTETEGFSSYETQQNRFYKITNSKSSEVTDKVNVFTTEIIDNEEVTKIDTKPTLKDKKNNIQNISDLKAQSHENMVHVLDNNEKHNPNDHKTKSHYATSTQSHQTRKENESEKNKNIMDNNDEKASNKTKKKKVNIMENVLKFMKVVADTIAKNSRRSFNGKMQYLHELKESILANIEERIDAAWPDDDSAGERRRRLSRSAHTSSRGHVQFPSSESSLMTISFLTFAVFLIKLVLQVIQTYKHKTMMVAPLMVASGRKVFTHRGQH